MTYRYRLSVHLCILVIEWAVQCLESFIFLAFPSASLSRRSPAFPVAFRCGC
ncbi:unnamed protein product [Musa acuminata subsp. burmannicoides]